MFCRGLPNRTQETGIQRAHYGSSSTIDTHLLVKMAERVYLCRSNQ
ncbi:hypothetical protein PROFUN_15501 [Planoprotostelium fungivorum]|uniref:Uncharacterized protein n=1 Tax=Planoprotostelium fungivorum TaxID=1890364 RepID=A0A2P6MSR0_9EUKA|nr:hypothetical protein PROFUN_15501 [Planoprotostelium fungivorum]